MHAAPGRQTEGQGQRLLSWAGKEVASLIEPGLCSSREQHSNDLVERECTTVRNNIHLDDLKSCRHVCLIGD